LTLQTPKEQPQKSTKYAKIESAAHSEITYLFPFALLAHFRGQSYSRLG
jgi:hypothetical protein